MSQESFAQLRKHVLEARALTGAEQRAYLDALEAPVRREVESLLGFDDQQASILDPERLASKVGDSLLHQMGSMEGPLPESIGGYRPVEVLGLGGMGIVYRAEQTEPIQREVAIKVIKRGMDTHGVVARFEAERQTLASLEHPNIARVLDAGEDGGAPYFVMELVRGQALTEFCDSRKLTTDQRLDLFVDVCQAIQHAHQRGIIHRDLKPSNVLVSLVDETAVVKVIDFGIAKVIEDTPGDLSMMTRMGQIIGTPDYMSPEQAGIVEGGVDTRSDIYSLGVLLYELLSGQRPHHFETASDAELRRVLREEEPLKPSTALSRDSSAESGRARRSTVRQLSRELSGDLDNIVMMAIRKEPDRRYPSVDSLAKDIDNYRSGRPVFARHDTWVYRTSKFMRRNAVGVALAVAGVVALAGFLGQAVVQNARVARERDRANTEAQSAKRVSEFLVELFEVSDPGEARGNTITAREVLDRGAQRIGTELEDDPLVRASLMDAIGRVYQSLGLYGPADSLLSQALDVRTNIQGARHPDVAKSQTAHAMLLLDLGRFEEARDLILHALEIQREELGDAHEEIANSLYYLASVYLELGEHDAAEQQFRELIEHDRRLHGEEHEYVALSLNDLGSALHRKGDYAQAELAYREALGIYKKLWGDDHPEVATTTANLGNLLAQQGKFEEAVEMSRTALAMRRKVLGPEHDHVAISLNNLGVQLMRQGKLDEAEQVIRQGLAIKLRVQGELHPTVAHSHLSLGTLLLRKKDFAGAESAFQKADAIHAQSLPPDHLRVARPLQGIAQSKLEQGDAAAAKSLLERALEIRRNALPADHPEVVSTVIDLGRCALALGNLAEAESLLTSGYEARMNAYGREDRRTREASARLVELYEAKGDPDGARRFRTDE